VEDETEVMLMMVVMMLVMMDGEGVAAEPSFTDDRLPSKDYGEKLTDQ
jgi:hypothetical protein